MAAKKAKKSQRSPRRQSRHRSERARSMRDLLAMSAFVVLLCAFAVAAQTLTSGIDPQNGFLNLLGALSNLIVWLHGATGNG